MQLSIKGKQIDVGDSLRNHVQQSLKDIIGKYFSTPLDAQVTFSREAHLFRVDINVHAGRGILMQSDASATEPYVTFDTAAAKIDKRLRRHKNRIKSHHKHNHEPQDSLPAQSIVLHSEEDCPPEDDVVNPVIVAEMTTSIDMLTVSEAVLRLDLGNLPALMFRNRAHGHLNMIYRRPDGHIGWVDPAQNVAVNKKPESQQDTAKSRAG
ncbi:MAG: ribosome-associated translation inhibitor RaiA [Alphaproteobacteria bacterium]